MSADSPPPADSLAAALRENYDLFGDPTKGEKLELTPPPAMKLQNYAALAGNSAMGDTYVTAVNLMNDKGAKFHESQQAIADKVNKDADKVSKDGREGITKLIGGINAAVASKSEIEIGNVNTYIVDMLNQAYSELIDNTETGAEKATGISKTIQDWTSEFEKDQAARDAAMQGKLNNALGALKPPGVTEDGTKGPGLEDLNLGADKDLDGIGGAEKIADSDFDPEKGLTPVDPDAEAAGSKIDDAIDSSVDSAQTPDTSVSNPALDTPSLGAGSGLMNPASMMGGVNPFMNNPMAWGNGMGPYGSLGDSVRNRTGDLDAGRIDRAVRPLTPQVQPQQPAPSTPWSNQNNATQVAHGGDAAPGTTSDQAGGTPPPRVPRSDGKVEYLFPNDRKQWVSQVVAQALDAAFANTKGTDAKAAYSGTSAKWSDNKQIGMRVDPSRLMTGDVALWAAEHTAIIVAFGSAEGGADPAAAEPAGVSDSVTGAPVSGNPDAGAGEGSADLQVIVAAEMKKFEPQMSDSGGDFGDFSGFAHPTGIEAAGKGDEDPGGGVPGDPSAGPTMSALAGTQSV